jgi:hypothetical protein
MTRRSNWTPVIVPNRADRTDGETKISDADVVIPEPAFAALNGPPRPTHLDNADTSSEDRPKVPDRKTQSQADLRFTIGIVVALALPALIGIGVYVATTVLLRAS